jgi:hypothetical protein
MSETLVKDNLDTLVTEKFVSFRRNVLHSFSEKHPHIFTIAQSLLANQQSKLGLQVLENGQIAGNYTIYLQGIDISKVEGGTLASEVRHPLIGTLKPYLIIERRTLEQLISEEAGFAADIFATFSKYLPEITIKFLR